MPRLLSRLVTGAALTISASIAACGGQGGQPQQATDDIVDVPQTPVKNQSISNCWIYATMAWAESLHVATGEAPLDISESYMTYWHWFDQIVYDGAPKNAIDETGFFKKGMDLIWRFGIMPEAAFIPEEGAATRSSRQSSAKSKMNESLRSGALQSPEARKDMVLVRRELDKAWGLSEDVVSKMNGVFGAGYDRSLNQPSAVIPEGTPITRASDIPILIVSGDDPTPRPATLADAIGDRAFDIEWGRRKGDLAWNEWSYPTAPEERRAFQKRIQRALHARQPVVFSWFIDFAAMSRAEFRAPPTRQGQQGGHVTVLEDYEIENVPGFGTLKAGVLETRPEALEASLADEANIVFFRIKNSWGSTAGPIPSFEGYLDLYTAYLHGPVKKCDRAEGATETTCVDHQPLWRVALPAGF